MRQVVSAAAALTAAGLTVLPMGAVDPADRADEVACAVGCAGPPGPAATVPTRRSGGRQSSWLRLRRSGTVVVTQLGPTCGGHAPARASGD